MPADVAPRGRPILSRKFSSSRSENGISNGHRPSLPRRRGQHPGPVIPAPPAPPAGRGRGSCAAACSCSRPPVRRGQVPLGRGPLPGHRHLEVPGGTRPGHERARLGAQLQPELHLDLLRGLGKGPQLREQPLDRRLHAAHGLLEALLGLLDDPLLPLSPSAGDLVRPGGSSTWTSTVPPSLSANSTSCLVISPRPPAATRMRTLPTVAPQGQALRRLSRRGRRPGTAAERSQSLLGRPPSGRASSAITACRRRRTAPRAEADGGPPAAPCGPSRSRLV